MSEATNRPPEKRKALTICQPYAHLIALGRKRVENRSWPTSYRGPLLIHAGKSREWLDDDGDGIDYGYSLPISEMAFGAVIAIADLVACVSKGRIDMGDFDQQYPWLKDHEHTEAPGAGCSTTCGACPIQSQPAEHKGCSNSR